MGLPRPIRWAFALLLLIASGCSWPAGLTGNNDRERYYFNANLLFAIEHPLSWSRVKSLSRKESTLGWTAPAEEGRAPAQTIVRSLPPSQATGGEERLEKEFLAAHPGFTITSREQEFLPAAPASRLTGYLPTRTFLVYFITSARRAFTIEFSAAPEDFDRYRPRFREMAESFRILE